MIWFLGTRMRLMTSLNTILYICHKFPSKLDRLSLRCCCVFSSIKLKTRAFGTSSGVNGNSESDDEKIQLPEAPTNCCMSGCANCVWIQYAEELSKIFKDGGEKSQQIIMKNVTDPSMQAFLLEELKDLEKDKT